MRPINKSILPFCFAIIAISLSHAFPGAASAQPAKSEMFYGVLDVKVERLRMHVVIQEDASGLSGYAISPDQSETETKLESIVLDDETFSFEMKPAQAKFEGTFNKDKTAATGKFKQGFSSFELTFRKVDRFPKVTHTESWAGIMKAGPKEFDFQLRILKDEDGPRYGRLDSFSEQVGNLYSPIDKEFEGFKFSVPATGATYEGKFSDDKKTITGKWKQRGAELPLELKSISLAETRVLKQKRPQTPKEPFDFDSTDIEVTSKKHKDVKLSGTLTTPKGKGDGPFPTAILISGSGPQDRDSTIYGHKSFLVLADHFAKQGIATLRYDERGIGKSKGNFAEANSRDLADDVSSLINALKSNKKVDAKKIVLVGHSEGGLIAPMVASERDDIAAIVMLAGPTVDGEKVVLNQTRKIQVESGIDKSAIDAQAKMMKTFFAEIKSGNDITDSTINTAYMVFSESVPKQIRDEVGSEEDFKRQVQTLNSPWFKYFLTYDPLPALQKTKCPILFLIGDKDTQVDAELHVPFAEKTFKASDNENSKIVRFPKLNHLFQECETGLPDEYIKISQTFAPKALKEISDWLKAVTK